MKPSARIPQHPTMSDLAEFYLRSHTSSSTGMHHLRSDVRKQWNNPRSDDSPLPATPSSTHIRQESSCLVLWRAQCHSPELVCAAWSLAAAVLSIVFTFHANAQTGGHLIVSKMVDKPNGQFAFEPSTITAQHGDTVRFVESSSAPHNVHFTKTPKGAKLGKASTGPYVIGAGKTYDLVIDSRFPDGSYEFVCDPHQGVGMQGVLTVASSVK